MAILPETPWSSCTVSPTGSVRLALRLFFAFSIFSVLIVSPLTLPAQAQSEGGTSSDTSNQNSGSQSGTSPTTEQPSTKSPRDPSVFDKVLGLEQLRSSYSIGITETFTDNVDLEPNGQEDSAILSDINAGLTLRRRTARVTSNWDGRFTLRHQTGGEDEGFNLIPRIAGNSNIEAIERRLFVDVSSSVSRELLNTREADSEANRETVMTTRLSPYLVHRWGSFASSQLRYAISQVRTGDTSTTQTLSYDLSSGPEFSRLRWSFTASGSESDSSDSGDISRRNVFLNTEYAIVRGFSVIAGAGYEVFEEDGAEAESSDFKGATWRAGVRWRPNRRLNWEITFGHQDNGDSVATSLAYDLGGRTRFILSYNESLQTGDERLITDLSLIGVDPVTGILIDLTTGLPFDPSNPPTSLEDQVTRNKTFRAALTATRGRNTFNLSTVFRDQREEDTLTPDNEKAYVFSGSWQRRLNPKTNFVLNGSHTTTKFDLDDREDKAYTATTSVDYRLFRNVTVFASYSYRQKDSSDNAEDYQENRAFIGFRHTF